MLFENCPTPASYRCKCNRLQQVVLQYTVGRVVSPGHFIDEGAIILEYMGTLVPGLDHISI